MTSRRRANHDRWNRIDPQRLARVWQVDVERVPSGGQGIEGRARHRVRLRDPLATRRVVESQCRYAKPHVRNRTIGQRCQNDPNVDRGRWYHAQLEVVRDTVEETRTLEPAIGQRARIDFRVTREDNVFPMIPSGQTIKEMMVRQGLAAETMIPRNSPVAMSGVNRMYAG